ncbi:MAG: 1,4-alpha-glucan branching protein GlgB [Pseudomonadota bacterium]|jgi:alpha-1,4-glucan:alpha-1,4-glucan 6-glycosyltransferase|nr:MAG: 1,4-alpha-glucan branching enzyme [Pseudomonadota bacterium]
MTLLTDHDIYLFREGTLFRAYEKLGAHYLPAEGGTHFGVWAPNAQSVSVIGDFNGWRPDAHRLDLRPDGSGIWEAFVPGVRPGALYKFHIVSRHGGYTVDKSDPFAFFCEVPPKTASIVWDLSYEWGDDEWMQRRRRANALDAPMSIYEVHIGSWRRVAEEGGRSLSYRELAHALGDYVEQMGFTHVELLPVMEHPFFGSWGYQITGYFAPSSRYGTPQDFMYLVDHLHRRGIGVILDWVPSHFPTDEHGLAYFDGTYLYEHADPRQGFHPEWNSSIFNYGRSEVREFLASSGLFWLDVYHVDALRVDAVASMLYLDYGRREGEWIPNRFGGRENLDAVRFLKEFNEAVYRDHPDTQTIAEESTAWPMVSRPTYLGGLGFGMKWNMGWMHDTLKYFQTDPLFRRYEHHKLTFSIWYAFTENFVLPLSHDEVVHGKGSLIGRMHGDEWQQFANLRLLYGYMWGHPGKKLLFMGGEFGQKREWQHDEELEWWVTQYPLHAGVQRWVRDLNAFYRATPSLHEIDFAPEGFEWIDANDAENSVLTFLRKGRDGDLTLVVCNFTPVVRENYRVGVPRGGFWRECLNSDAREYGGSGQGNLGGVEASPLPFHGRFHSLSLRLPPLGVLFLKPQ